MRLLEKGSQEECALKEMPLVVIKRLSNHSKVGMERELIDRWDCLLQSVYIPRALETISNRIGDVDPRNSCFNAQRQAFIEPLSELLKKVLPQPKEGHLVRVVLLPMGRIRSHRMPAGAILDFQREGDIGVGTLLCHMAPLRLINQGTDACLTF